jgi:hypothetical protein
MHDAVQLAQVPRLCYWLRTHSRGAAVPLSAAAPRSSFRKPQVSPVNQLQLITAEASGTEEAWTSTMDVWNGTPAER